MRRVILPIAGALGFLPYLFIVWMLMEPYPMDEAKAMFRWFWNGGR